MGPSGYSKSTILNIVASIDSLYDDEILVCGKLLTASIDTDLIVIFQEDASLFPWLTVYENVEFRLKVSKLKERKDI